MKASPYQEGSPDLQTVFRGQIHAVPFFGAVGLVELFKLHDNRVCAQIGERVGVLLDGERFRLQGRQAPPVGCQCAEETVVIEVFFIGCDAEHAFDAGQVCDRFCVEHGTVDRIIRDGLKPVVVVYKLLRALVEFAVVVLCPPVAEIALFIVLPSGSIKSMGDLMRHDDTDMSQFFFTGHLIAVENTAQNSRRDIDGIVKRIVVSVDILRRCDPNGAVDGLVDLICDRQAGLFGDGDPGVDQASALFGALEIQNVFCLFALSSGCSGSIGSSAGSGSGSIVPGRASPAETGGFRKTPEG